VERRAARPTAIQLAAAVGKSVPDIIAADLKVLFCGVNPGLWSAAVGHHFARPGNRFWKALHLSGFTDDLISHDNERDLLRYGLGITNLVDRATRAADELNREDLQDGARRLTSKVQRWKPRCVAVLGMGAYRSAFSDPHAKLGSQPSVLGPSRVWLLPNPSGAQARYQIADLVEQFGNLRSFVSRLP
jgi:double-stranded uracil-DNA glycosylase